MLRQRITLCLVAAIIALGLTVAVTSSFNLLPPAAHTNIVALDSEPPDPTPTPPPEQLPYGGGGVGMPLPPTPTSPPEKLVYGGSGI